MDTRLLDYRLKELFGLNKKHKMEAISMLIDSIADDKVYEAESFFETEKQRKELKNNESEG
ncbi:hypothetical protein [Clostridium sp.]|uniref:hypothetical protein n=1 Tax=Clostridium sp. TaxID=1506 RepID=UPI00260DB9A5|nr:hypothetical protein [Clostridium sp.]